MNEDTGPGTENTDPVAADSNVDPADLQRDLDQIKEAMGLAERYKGATNQWLLFGVSVAIGAALSQYVVLNRLAGWWHTIIWLGIVVGGTYLVIHFRYGAPTVGPGRSEPNIGFQLLAIYFGVLPIQVAVGAFLPDLGYLAQNALSLGVILILLGLGFLVAGETLKAYHIRARDRRAFHVGGIGMIALGTAIPLIEFLHTWGFAAFGVGYLTYALLAYGVLTRE
jgi:hypothetical protein